MIPHYERLAELAECEAALVSDGRLDALEPLWAERRRVMEMLPDAPPESARPFLRRAERAVRSTQATLEARLAETRAQLAEITRGRQAAAGYGGPATSGSLDAHA